MGEAKCCLDGLEKYSYQHPCLQEDVEVPRLEFVQPRKQNPRYLCAFVSLFGMLERTVVLACSVSNKILLKIRPYNNISDEIYFCSGVSLSFQHPPLSPGAFNLGHSICSWQRSRLIGIEMYKGDTKLAIHPK